ncbi:flocculation protein FLO11-like [Gigantopelta aegis]|uniref:flocculation protein FLO11-like n=1 Tax=Gigantopelta aegis TaxID=1735272 RepID=UPI001B8897C8|nr:flocculation protein FLO11-like [Gigantopelta aegis]
MNKGSPKIIQLINELNFKIDHQNSQTIFEKCFKTHNFNKEYDLNIVSCEIKWLNRKQDGRTDFQICRKVFSETQIGKEMFSASQANKIKSVGEIISEIESRNRHAIKRNIEKYSDETICEDNSDEQNYKMCSAPDVNKIKSVEEIIRKIESKSRQAKQKRIGNHSAENNSEEDSDEQNEVYTAPEVNKIKSVEEIILKIESKSRQTRKRKIDKHSAENSSEDDSDEQNKMYTAQEVNKIKSVEEIIRKIESKSHQAKQTRIEKLSVENNSEDDSDEQNNKMFSAPNVIKEKYVEETIREIESKSLLARKRKIEKHSVENSSEEDSDEQNNEDGVKSSKLETPKCHTDVGERPISNSLKPSCGKPLTVSGAKIDDVRDPAPSQSYNNLVKFWEKRNHMLLPSRLSRIAKLQESGEDCNSPVLTEESQQEVLKPHSSPQEISKPYSSLQEISKTCWPMTQNSQPPTCEQNDFRSCDSEQNVKSVTLRTDSHLNLSPTPESTTCCQQDVELCAAEQRDTCSPPPSPENSLSYSSPVTPEFIKSQTPVSSPGEDCNSPVLTEESQQEVLKPHSSPQEIFKPYSSLQEISKPCSPTTRNSQPPSCEQNDFRSYDSEQNVKSVTLRTDSHLNLSPPAKSTTCCQQDVESCAVEQRDTCSPPPSSENSLSYSSPVTPEFIKSQTPVSSPGEDCNSPVLTEESQQEVLKPHSSPQDISKPYSSLQQISKTCWPMTQNSQPPTCEQNDFRSCDSEQNVKSVTLRTHSHLNLSPPPESTTCCQQDVELCAVEQRDTCSPPPSPENSLSHSSPVTPEFIKSQTPVSSPGEDCNSPVLTEESQQEVLKPHSSPQDISKPYSSLQEISKPCSPTTQNSQPPSCEQNDCRSCDSEQNVKSVMLRTDSHLNLSPTPESTTCCQQDVELCAAEQRDTCSPPPSPENSLSYSSPVTPEFIKSQTPVSSPGEDCNSPVLTEESQQEVLKPHSSPQEIFKPYSSLQEISKPCSPTTRNSQPPSCEQNDFRSCDSEQNVKSVTLRTHSHLNLSPPPESTTCCQQDVELCAVEQRDTCSPPPSPENSLSHSSPVTPEFIKSQTPVSSPGEDCNSPVLTEESQQEVLKPHSSPQDISKPYSSLQQISKTCWPMTQNSQPPILRTERLSILRFRAECQICNVADTLAPELVTSTRIHDMLPAGRRVMRSRAKRHVFSSSLARELPIALITRDS